MIQWGDGKTIGWCLKGIEKGLFYKVFVGMALPALLVGSPLLAAT